MAILPIAMMAPIPDLFDQAFAQPAEGSHGQIPPKSYGSATKEIVCGDRLCSTPEGMPDPINVGTAQ
ncbi:MAG TPA: hypothetical protein VD731_06460 [Nitrosopumilaceae archaeon]|nr:hypothetical protein [Nitrosopumilaceae archaeon]